MKRKTVGLYNPYLDSMGGGERHVLSILKVLDDDGYTSTVFWDQDLTEKIQDRLHLDFKNGLQFLPNIFMNGSSFIKKASDLSKFDIFIYVSDGSYFFSTAKKNYVFAMVPSKELYSMGTLNKLKTKNYMFVCNSLFTQKNLKKWNIKADVLYPYLDNEYVEMDLSNVKKQKTILSVGRFFKHLHAKRQDMMIQFYKQLKSQMSELHEYNLILAGGLNESDRLYFEELQKLIGDDRSIVLKPNISYKELTQLYSTSEIYWHFAGYDINEDKDPQLTEHLGITPLESMACGCTAFCFKAGGLKETIQDEETGYLFSSFEELKDKMKHYFQEGDHTKMKIKAKAFIEENFTYEIFKKNVHKIFLEH